MIGFNYQELKDYDNSVRYFEESYLINIKITKVDSFKRLRTQFHWN
jgi:hypothetical protein